MKTRSRGRDFGFGSSGEPRARSAFDYCPFEPMETYLKHCLLAVITGERMNERKRLDMKISIRDLLWLMVVAALLVGWWREHSLAVHAQSEVLSIKKEYGDAKDKALQEAAEARSVLEAYQHHFEMPSSPDLTGKSPSK